MKKTLLLGAATVAIAGFLYLPYLVFFKAPLAPYYELLFNQKIFYYHVPCAWVMFLGTTVAGIASIGYLRTRKPGWDDVAWGAGDMVTLFGAIVLTTGPIWAKASWGVYWKWDARLTTSLLLWLTFVAYSLVRRYGGLGSERLAAGLAVFGAVNSPLVYFAVNLWKTSHPQNTVVQSLAPGMRGPFWLGNLTFIMFFCVLIAARVAIGRGHRRLASAHDLALETGALE